MFLLKFGLVRNTFVKAKQLPEFQGLTLVFKGNQNHYEILHDQKQMLRKKKIFLYQRQPIDLGLQMIRNKTKVLTYITKQRYETVCAKQLVSQQKIHVEQSESLKLLNFLNNHRFEIRKSFLDLHPLDAYHSICSLLGTNKMVEHMRCFSFCNFSKNEIKQNTMILEYKTKLWKEYLQVDGLKLRKLDRKKKGNENEIKQAILFWKNMFEIEQVYSSTKQDQQFKIKFVLENKLGQFVNLQDLLEGYGQRSFYATWQNDSIQKQGKE